MREQKPHVDIFTDGACRGNPGAGGYGVVLRFTDEDGHSHEKELSQGYLSTTNNRMELMAAIAGLELLKKPCHVHLFSDSKYLIDAFEKHWVDSWVRQGWVKKDRQPVKNVTLWKRLMAAKDPHDVRFIWVKGHAGNMYNERCDYLATSAADGEDLIPDDLGK